MKKIVRYLLYVLVALILAAIIVPYVFKDRIIEQIKSLANENIQHATLDFKDVDLSLLSSFPKLSLKIQQLSVEGADHFEGIKLLSAEELAFDMNITPLFDSEAEPKISYIGLKEADINVYVDQLNRANYDISIPDTTSTQTQFEIALNKYELEDCSISYVDKASDIAFSMKGLNHEGIGNFTESIFDLSTSTTAEEVNLKMEGMSYLRKVETALDAIINIDLNSNTYTLSENALQLNKLKLNGNGTVQLVGNAMNIDIAVTAPGNAFGELVSVFPFIPIEPGMKVEGRYKAQAKATGTYDGAKGLYPLFNFDLEIDNGSIQYEGLPYPVDNIQSEIHVQSRSKLLDQIEVNIPVAKAQVKDSKFEGSFNIQDVTSDPLVEGNLITDIQLSDIKDAVPLKMNQLDGLIKGNASFKARQSNIDNENYDAIEFAGEMHGTDLVIDGEDYPKVTARDIAIIGSPKMLDVRTSDFNINDSNIKADAKLNNPLAIFTQNAAIDGIINVEADQFDMNPWMAEDPNTTAELTVEEDTETVTKVNLNDSNIKMNISIGNLKYEDYNLNDFTYRGDIGYDNVHIDQFSTTIQGSDLNATGDLINPGGYFLKDEVLSGDIYFSSKDLNVDKIMAAMGEDDTSEPASEEPLRIPQNINLNINTDIQSLTFTEMGMKQFKGDIGIQNGTAAIEGMQSNILGGKISMDGLYDSSVEQPTFNTKLDLSNIKFNKAYDELVSMRMLAPIAKYIEGFFNTTLVFKGQVTNGMTPDFNTLDASGYIETLNSTIKNAQPIEQIADKLNIDKLKSLDLENTKNWFEVKGGRLELKEKDLDIEGIASKIRGGHSLGGDMAYEIDMAIPRKMLQNSNVAAYADKGLSYLLNQAGKLGVNVNQGEFINIRVKLGGKLSKPTVKIVPLGTSGESVEDDLKNQVKNTTDQVKDTIRKEVEKKKEEAMDTVKKVVDKQVDKAKEEVVKQADKIVDKATDQVKDKAKELVDSTIVNAVTDSLAGKVKDVINGNTDGTVDDIKDKIKDWNPFKKKKKKKKNN